jgi:transposase InsO family protein
LRRPPESIQYCSTDYQAELRKHGILISMSGRGNCFDNSMVETFFKTLKCELVWRTVFETRQEAERAIGRYSDGFYNPVRRHSALDFTVRRQMLWDRRGAELTEDLAHLGCDVRWLGCGAASGVAGWSGA